MHRELAGLLLSLLVLTACGDGPPVGPGPPEPPLTLESGAARSATIGSRGGSISTTASDGTVYTLEIPAGALPSPQEIALTPIRSIRDLGLSGGLAGAVELEPSGLVFTRPAVLRIRTSRSAPTGTRLVGFTGGQKFTWRTLSPAAAQAGEVRVPVFHFSQSGAGFGTIEDVRRFSTSIPAGLGLDGLFGDLLSLVPGPWDAARQLRADSLARRALDQFVLPGLQNADTDARLVQAIAHYVLWRQMLSIVAFADVTELFGVDDFALTIPEPFVVGHSLAQEAAEPKLRAAVEGNIRVCGAEGSRLAHRNVYFWLDKADRMRVDVFPDLAELSERINHECVRPVLLRHNLPPTVTPGEQLTLEVRFAAEYANGRRDTTDFLVRLVGSGVTIQHPNGFTGIGDASSPLGFYTTTITPTSTGMSLRAIVTLLDTERVPPAPDPNPGLTASRGSFDLASGSCVVAAGSGIRGPAVAARAASSVVLRDDCEDPPPPPPLDLSGRWLLTIRGGGSDAFPPGGHCPTNFHPSHAVAELTHAGGSLNGSFTYTGFCSPGVTASGSMSAGVHFDPSTGFPELRNWTIRIGDVSNPQRCVAYMPEIRVPEPVPNQINALSFTTINAVGAVTGTNPFGPCPPAITFVVGLTKCDRAVNPNVNCPASLSPEAAEVGAVF